MNEREGRGRRPAIRCRSFWPGGIHKIRYDCCWDELGWKERGREIGRNMFSSVSFLSGLSVSTSDPLELRWQKTLPHIFWMDYTSQWCSDQSFRISGLKTGLWPCPKWGEIERASSYIGNLPLALWRIRNSNGGGGAQSSQRGRRDTCHRWACRRRNSLFGKRTTTTAEQPTLPAWQMRWWDFVLRILCLPSNKS